MPVADFPGGFGWGYDGVDLFAPTRLYGRPDDFRHSSIGRTRSALGVILDVVYNHFGPDGNYLGQFSADYFTERYRTEWGEAINFDGAGSAAGPRVLRRATPATGSTSITSTGLRLDATQHIFDDSPEHILAEIGARARGRAPGDRIVLLSPRTSRRTRGSSARWRRAATASTRSGTTTSTTRAMVALTGRDEAYYTDYSRHASGARSRAVKCGYLYQGQRYAWQGKRRGTPARGHRAVGLRQLHPEPRPGRQLPGRRCAATS